MMKRVFLSIAAATLLCAQAAANDTLSVKFLGTGAADWKGPAENGEYRRNTSLLVGGGVLVDFNKCNADMLPPRCKPAVAFYTHSHADHYNALAALEQGIRKVYVSETWAPRAAKDFADASAATGLPVPEIVPLKVGDKVWEGGMRFTALPGNHATKYLDEQCLIYLIEKGEVRLLYATDTGGIMAVAARLAGIDAHAAGTPITALIMEATMGEGYDENFRIYSHSSTDEVLRTVHVLTKTGRYNPAPGQSVYLTHLARTLHPAQKELDAGLPSPLKAAYDGLDVDFVSTRPDGPFPLYTVYPEVSGKSTPAPKGYKPFYISHLGRHGSRYLSEAEYYSQPYKMLSAQRDNLTALGEKLLSEVTELYRSSKGNLGELTPLGVREHEEITLRMVANYPEIFNSKTAAVEYYTSNASRANASADAAMAVLRRDCPDLGISSLRFNKKLFPSSGRHTAQKKTDAYKKNQIYKAKPEAFSARIFKDPSKVKRDDAKRIMERVWRLSCAQTMLQRKADFSEFLTDSDCFPMWKQRNLYVYTSYGPSPEFRDIVLADIMPIAGDVAARADSVIAAGATGATLRFAHDVQVIPFAAVLGIENTGDAVSDLNNLHEKWDSRSFVHMAMNVQLVFYRKAAKASDILVKVLLNEEEVHLTGLKPVKWPYYRWEDVKFRILREPLA